MDYRTQVKLRDFIIFQAKLWVDGLKDFALIGLSTLAFVVDLVFKLHGRRRYFPRLMRTSKRFDQWLDLHGAAEHLEEADDELFGDSKAGSDKLLAEIEEMVRGTEGSPTKKPQQRPQDPSM